MAGADRPCLFEVRSHTWHDWVFVNPDGRAPAFKDYLAPAIEYIDGYDLTQFRCAHHESYAFDCNWKLAVENYCDFYHVFNGHPELNARMAMDSRRPMTVAGLHLVNGFDFATSNPRIASDTPEATFPLIPGLADNLASQMRYAVLFPNTAVNVYPNSAQFVLFDPVAPDVTVMHMWFYCVADTAQDPAFAQARDKHYAQWANLNGEDEEVCRRIQEGRSSEAYDGGRLAPYWDIGTVHFHRQIAEAVRGEGAFARLS